MKLNHGRHLAYCTNIHRGENWAETFGSLKTHTLAVRERVCPGWPYAIGLRLSNQAARELSDPQTLREFQAWLDKNQCYVFTINGFPFGRFHGARVKEQVYAPDWTSPERLEYTNLLFDLLARIVPAGVEGSVSTLPGSFKEFITDAGQPRRIRDNIWRCVEHITNLSQRTGKILHLGVEPEPLGWFETSAETIGFFETLRAEHGNDPRLNEHLGVNYDTCHLAVEFEEARAALDAFQKNGIKISKLHLSSALKVRPTAEARESLHAFADDIYLHQVIVRTSKGTRLAYRDLAPALAAWAHPHTAPGRSDIDIPTPHPNPPHEPSPHPNPLPSRGTGAEREESADVSNWRSIQPSMAGSAVQSANFSGNSLPVEERGNPKPIPGPDQVVAEAFADPADEWRIHFHIPLHSPASAWYQNTSDHVLGALDWLRDHPGLCSHLEMETYTWEVLPPELKNRSVVDQLVAEYDWTLAQLSKRGLGEKA